IAIDSQTIVPSSSITGTWPFGFTLRYSGLRDSPRALTGTCSYLSPSSSSAHRARAARDIEVPYTFIISIPPLVGYARICDRPHPARFDFLTFVRNESISRLALVLKTAGP